MIKPTEFTKLFKLLRTDKKLYMWQVSKAIGISTSHLSNIERGIKLPSNLRTIRKIEQLLNCTDGQLVKLAREDCQFSRRVSYNLLRDKPELMKILIYLDSLSPKQVKKLLASIDKQK